MAEEPFIYRDETLNVGDPSPPRGTTLVVFAYLHRMFLRLISWFRLHADDTPQTPVATTSLKSIVVHRTSFQRSDSSPSIFTDEKGLVHRESFAPHRRRLTAPQIILVALLGLLLYVIAGITVFTFASDSFKGHKTLKLIDGVYFTIVTLCTIGYGDIVPATTFTKLFTCLFILVGFGFIDILLNGLVTYVLDIQEEVLLDAVDRKHFSKMINTYVIDKKKRRMRIRTKMSLALGVVLLSLIIGTVTAHYFVEDLAWVDSLYLTVTSVTTVGYGDYAFETAAGRCFAIVWLLMSTLAVARAFLYIVEYRIEKRNHRTAEMVLQKKLTLGDLVAADLDHDGSISKADFVLYKLREMGKIDEKDIVEICEQFDTLVSPDHSKITVADLMEGGKEVQTPKIDGPLKE